MAQRFTTITDVTAAIIDADPGFEDELSEQQLRDIVSEHHAGRYEEITEEEFESMLVAAYVATGIDEAAARRLVRN